MTGLPRYKHANAHGSVFVFDGTQIDEKECADMDKGRASWITQNREYKRKVMVQENGAIAAERHTLEHADQDRLLALIRERDQAQAWAREVTDGQRLFLATSVDELPGEKGQIWGRLQREADLVEAARGVVRARHARDPGASQNAHDRSTARRASRAASSPVKKKKDAFYNLTISLRAAGGVARPREQLAMTEERAFMRFLKEGPRPGDPVYREPPAVAHERQLKATFPRADLNQVNERATKMNPRTQRPLPLVTSRDFRLPSNPNPGVLRPIGNLG